MVGPAIRSFARPYTLTRYGATVRAGGRVQAQEGAPLAGFKAAIVPVSGSDMRRLPEGTRQDETIGFFAEVEVFTGGNGRQADRIEYKGANYCITNVERWDEHGAFFHALAVREEVAR